MKKILFYLSIYIYLTVNSLAGVKDFKINGIALNDSLLEHFSQDEIDASLRLMENELKDYDGGQHKKKYKKFVFAEDPTRKLGEFTILEIAFKEKDKKLRAKFVQGRIPVKDKSSCIADRDKRIDETKKILRAVEVNRSEIGNRDWVIFITNGEPLAWMICADKNLAVAVMYRDYLEFIRREK